MGKRKERARRFTHEAMGSGVSTGAVITGTQLKEACNMLEKLNEQPSSKGEGAQTQAGLEPAAGAATAEQREVAMARSIYRGSLWRGPMGRRTSKELEDLIASALQSL